MSVLIRGMKMPTSCLECVFYRRIDPVYDYCCISSATPKGYVPSDCPLVPIPPHGRLIDADVLLKGCERVTTEFATREFAFSQTAIESAPTILPAEEGE